MTVLTLIIPRFEAKKRSVDLNLSTLTVQTKYETLGKNETDKENGECRKRKRKVDNDCEEEDSDEVDESDFEAVGEVGGGKVIAPRSPSKRSKRIKSYADCVGAGYGGR